MITLLLYLAMQVQALSFSQPAVDDHWNSIVQITTDGLDSEQERVNSYCVATFLNPKVLVTAAHCVHHASLLKSNLVKIDLGRYEYRTRPDGTVFRLGYVNYFTSVVKAQFYFNSGLTKKIQNNKWKTKILPDEDLALIVLEEPFQQELKFLNPLTDLEIRSIKKNVLTYTPTIITINFIEEMSLDTKRAATLNDIKSASARSWSSKSQSRVQPGDSGAPLLIRTGQEWKLIGVVKGQAKTVFSDWDVFASFELNLCEISKQHTLGICN